MRVQLCFSLTFRGNLHLFGAYLDLRSLVFSLLILTPCLGSLQNLPSCPILQLASRSLSALCHLAPLLVPCPAVSTLPQGSLADVIYTISFAAVRRQLPEGSTRQPDCSWEAALTPLSTVCVQQQCSACICSLGSFLKSTMKRISVPKQSDVPALLLRHSITVKCHLEMFCFIS